MLIRFSCVLAIIVGCCSFSWAGPSENAARDVVQRLIGPRVGEFNFQQIPGDNGLDVYQIDAADGKVNVSGSSPVAMCRGAYDYLRQTCNVSFSWYGQHVDLPARFPDLASTRVVSPYRIRQYYNVCTFGYTTAFWGWDQWQHELDWMALHGINMALADVGEEAIWQRIWLKEGITQKELDAYFTGPAFLPWHRMGNINGHDGPLPQSWQTKTVVLQKQILQRMRELGIEPLAPAFAGYVPPAFARIHPDAKLIHSSDWGGFPKKNQTCILDPASPLFAGIGKDFTVEWEKEYGPAKYFLADTFNEMSVPVPADRPGRLARLADYGDDIYRSVIAGQPDATWVMQGWMFYSSGSFWDPESVHALLSKVPDDRMIILDLACDFQSMWKRDHSFFGKQWVHSTIHNFGGKSTLGGNLSLFASEAANALASPNRGNLMGFGMAPEGVENNEVVYELLCDAAWSDKPVDLDPWIERYCKDRYGAYPQKMQQAWQLLRKSCYARDVHEVRAGYVHRPVENPRWGERPDDSKNFHDAVQLMLDCSDELGKSDLYRDDVIELVTQYLGSRVDHLLMDAMAAHRADNPAECARLGKEALDLMDDMDALMACHPLHRLDRWVDLARAWADPSNKAEADYYEQDAKRQITVWGGPELTEYSARVWSGLIRGYYRERWAQFLDFLAKGGDARNFDIRPWEEKWITTPGVIEPVRKIDDPIAEAKRLFAKGEQLAHPQ